MGTGKASQKQQEQPGHLILDALHSSGTWGGLQRNLEGGSSPSHLLCPSHRPRDLSPSPGRCHVLPVFPRGSDLFSLGTRQQVSCLPQAVKEVIIFFISCPLLTHNCNHVTFNRGTKQSPSLPHHHSLANKMERFIKNSR